MQRGCHRYSRPKPIGSNRSVTTQDHGNSTVVRVIFKFLPVVFNSLSPASCRRVLRTYITRHWQHGRAVIAGEITHHANIPSVTITAAFGHGSRHCIFKREPKREHQRARPVVCTCRIFWVSQMLAENYLYKFMPPC